MSEINNQETNETPQTEGDNNLNNETPQMESNNISNVETPQAESENIETPPAQTPPPVQTPPTSTYTSMYDQPLYDSTPEAVKPNNNMILAIVSTVLSLVGGCCGLVGCIGVVVGIIAIVFSFQVDTKFREGDIEGAELTAQRVKTLSYVALATFVLSIILYIISLITGFGANLTQRYLEELQGYY